MRVNTRGSFMDLILDILAVSAFVVSLITNVFFFFKIFKLERAADNIIDQHPKAHDVVIRQVLSISRKISVMSEDMDRSFLSLKESIQISKPHKENNFDSLKKAFSGPTRGVVDG
jgi:hypothetical protein